MKSNGWMQTLRDRGMARLTAALFLWAFLLGTPLAGLVGPVCTHHDGVPSLLESVADDGAGPGAIHHGPIESAEHTAHADHTDHPSQAGPGEARASSPADHAPHPGSGHPVDDEHSGASDSQHDHEGDSACTCVGSCHGPTAPVSCCEVHALIVAAGSTWSLHGAPVDEANVTRDIHTLLPFANAPPRSA